jgi:hypothetical protein
MPRYIGERMVCREKVDWNKLAVEELEDAERVAREFFEYWLSKVELPSLEELLEQDCVDIYDLEDAVWGLKDDLETWYAIVD